MLIQKVSTGLQLALQQGNSTQTTFWQPAPFPIVKELDSIQAGFPLGAKGTVDGLVRVGFPGQFAENLVQIQPWCDGAPGSQFSMRLHGFKRVGPPDVPFLWSPLFLAEFLCTAGNIGGMSQATGPGADVPIFGMANLCETIALTQGTLGLTGEINSTGPGSNLPAWCTVELKGSQFIYFDFQAADTGNNIGMNCFWSFA